LKEKRKVLVEEKEILKGKKSIEKALKEKTSTEKP